VIRRMGNVGTHETYSFAVFEYFKGNVPPIRKLSLEA
jgi:hypothetical protein